jgi:hypothetical protein
MTSSDFDDDFSFVIDDNMLSKPLNREHCEAICHLINFVPIDSIIRNRHRNQIKVDPFKDLIKKINDSTFSTDEL